MLGCIVGVVFMVSLIIPIYFLVDYATKKYDKEKK